MKIASNIPLIILALGLVLAACTVAKLEARLEADPQCKPIINPKTGALMPCPGTDKAFYLAVGLSPIKTDVTTTSGSSPSTEIASKDASLNTSGVSPIVNQNKSASTKSDCKLKIHQKTGEMLPCLYQ